MLDGSPVSMHRSQVLRTTGRSRTDYSKILPSWWRGFDSLHPLHL